MTFSGNRLDSPFGMSPLTVPRSCLSRERFEHRPMVHIRIHWKPTDKKKKWCENIHHRLNPFQNDKF